MAQWYKLYNYARHTNVLRIILKGYNNAFKYDNQRNPQNSVGLGGNISQSIFSCKYGTIPTERYEVDHNDEDSGNGSLMRLAPIPIYFHSDIDIARKYAFESSFTTHPGYIAAEACSLMAYIIVAAIHFKENGIDFMPQANVQKFMKIVTERYLKILIDERAVL